MRRWVARSSDGAVAAALRRMSVVRTHAMPPTTSPTTTSRHQLRAAAPALAFLQRRGYAARKGRRIDEEEEDEQLAKELAELSDHAGPEDAPAPTATATPATPAAAATGETVDVDLQKMARPPPRYDSMSSTSVYHWRTTAKHGRRIVGPMGEWADELKYRAGITVQWEPVDPDKLYSGGYPVRDDVEVDMYFFGTDMAVTTSVPLIQSMVQQNPVYVRCALYRRRANNVEWLVLRRINGEVRPPDIPPITLKTPGKWTLLYENPREATVRTVWEETGIHIEEANMIATNIFDDQPAEFYWRVPVHYHIAEVPGDVEVLGPQSTQNTYMLGWDPKALQKSPDVMDRVWSKYANPKTGCAWLTSKQIDELQYPLRGEDYMATRYTPPPHTNLQDVVGLHVPKSQQPDSS